MADEVSNRGLAVAAAMLLVAVVLAFVGLIAVSDLHKAKCPSAGESSPSTPVGRACLHIQTVHGSGY